MSKRLVPTKWSFPKRPPPNPWTDGKHVGGAGLKERYIREREAWEAANAERIRAEKQTVIAILNKLTPDEMSILGLDNLFAEASKPV